MKKIGLLFLAFVLMSCTHKEAWVDTLNQILMPDYMASDSLVDVYLKYNQPVNGYEVTARWRAWDKDSETGPVIINFRHIETGRNFQYFSPENESYTSHTIYEITFKEGFHGHKDNDIHLVDWISPDDESNKAKYVHSPLGYYTDFQFLDIDFDGEDELLLSDWYQGQPGNQYHVYKLTDKGLVKQEYLPLSDLYNITEIDLGEQTIMLYSWGGVSESVNLYFTKSDNAELFTNTPEFLSGISQHYFELYNQQSIHPFALDSIVESIDLATSGKLSAKYKAIKNRLEKVQ